MRKRRKPTDQTEVGCIYQPSETSHGESKSTGMSFSKNFKCEIVVYTTLHDFTTLWFKCTIINDNSCSAGVYCT